MAARAGRVPVLLAEEEGDRGVAVAGWADSAGPPGEWASGKRQVSPTLLCFIFLFVLFFYLIFCHCFEFKIIQTMPNIL